VTRKSLRDNGNDSDKLDVTWVEGTAAASEEI
jgi:hypothetical protein